MQRESLVDERADVRAVSFDVTGTLIHCPRLGAVYADVLSRHGMVVDAAAIEEAFPVVWRELDCSVAYGTDRFTSHADGASGWWRRLLERLCALLDYDPPPPFAAAELFGRFRQADAWEVYPEVESALSALSALAGRGVRLAVLSNWDERLPDLLRALSLDRFFEHVVYSAQVGVEKPHPAIFEALLGALDVPPESLVHVGDRRIEDVEGAAAAGSRGVLVTRNAAPPDGAVGDLDAFVELLEVGWVPVDSSG